jgi:nicotinamide phosphoribosyltransferase
MANLDNIILATDSYKLNHHDQYPKDIEAVYSYFEARNGAEFPYTIFFGLQYLLKKHLVGKVVTMDNIREAKLLSEAHFGTDKLFNCEGWLHIVEEHGGRLPLRIKAVPEGMKVPNSNVMMTVENTCPKCFWLTNALESLLVHVWYPSTVATLSHYTINDIIGGYLANTSDSMDGLPFMLHDFGYRGASSHETAAIGGAAALVNAKGTDNLPGMLLAQEYYRAGLDVGLSVPATEHSVMTARGEEGEFEVVQQLLDEHPTGILSVVADSYDIDRFVETIGTRFRDQIMARDGKFVVRPDSGNPVDTSYRTVNRLWELFPKQPKPEGSYAEGWNGRGYKILNEKVGVLWGDGIDPKGIGDILDALAFNSYAASNMVFGMGGGLLQKVNRDTQRFAFKASANKRNGEWHDIFKNPKDQTKVSKKGRLKLSRLLNGDYETAEDFVPPHDHVDVDDVLELVFANGDLYRDMTFDQVRENAAK